MKKFLVPLFALVVLLMSSCIKPSDQSSEEPLDTHSTWTDDSTGHFWD